MSKRDHSAKKAAVFDFDGTLADSVEILRKVYDEIAQEKSWRRVTDHREYEKFRKFTIRQGMAYFGIKPWQLFGLVHDGRKRFLAHVEEVKLFEGMDDLVRKLTAEGWDVYVLSSNSHEAIEKVLVKYDLQKVIHILDRPSFLSKARNLQRLVRRHRYDPHNVWMIGDEERDIRSANKAGVQSVAVAWGLQDISLLQACEPTSSADSPEQIYLVLSGRNRTSGGKNGKSAKKSR